MVDFFETIGICEAFLGEVVLERLIERILLVFIHWSSSDTAILFLGDGTSGSAIVCDADGLLDIKVQAAALKRVPQSLLRDVVTLLKPIVFNDTAARLIMQFEGILDPRVSSIVFLPLLNRGKLEGVLYLESTSPNIFTPEKLMLFQAISFQAAVSIDRARLQAQVELTKHEARSAERERRLTSDMVPSLIWRTSAKGHLEECNSSWHEFTGISAEMAKGFRYMKAFHPDDAKMVFNTWKSFIKSGLPGEFEARMVRFDGQARHFLIRAVPLIDNQGCVVKWYGCNTDIEDLRQAQNELMRSRDVLAEAQRISRTGSWSWSSATDEIKWSAECARLFGFDPEENEITYLDLLKRVHPDDRDLIESTHAMTMRGGGDFSKEHRIVWPDGSTILVESRGRLIGDRPDAIEYIGTIRDITESRRVQNLIREGEFRYEATLSSIADGLISTDSRERITFLNPTAETLTGWTRSESIGKKIEDIFHLLSKETRQRLDDPVSEILRFGTVEKIGNIVLVGKSGHEYPIESSCSPIVDDNGQMAGAVMVFRDITQRLETEDALRKSREDLARISRLTTIGELTVSIAHEINQPLAAVVVNAGACLGWLGDRNLNLAQARSAAERIVTFGQRAGEVLNSIRALSRNSPPLMTSMNIREAIEEALLFTRVELRRQGIKVQTDFSADTELILGDRVQLQQVLLNLIMNSAEAMASQNQGLKSLRISTNTDSSGYLKVTVSDKGPGLDPSNMERIFDSFYTTKPNGIGIGLSICRSIISAHGGRIGVEDASSNGSTFFFTVPTI